MESCSSKKQQQLMEKSARKMRVDGLAEER